MFAFAFLHPCEFVEILNFTRNPNGDVAGIEAGDSLDAASSRKNGILKVGAPYAIGADHSHAGNDDAFSHDQQIGIRLTVLGYTENVRPNLGQEYPLRGKVRWLEQKLAADLLPDAFIAARYLCCQGRRRRQVRKQ